MNVGGQRLSRALSHTAKQWHTVTVAHRRPSGREDREFKAYLSYMVKLSKEKGRGNGEEGKKPSTILRPAVLKHCLQVPNRNQEMTLLLKNTSQKARGWI